MFSTEEAHTNFIDFGLIQSEHEPAIYHTKGEHVNYYTKDMVEMDW